MINPFGFIITVLYFKFAQYAKSFSLLKNFPPIVIAGFLLIVTLVGFHIDYAVYNEGAHYLTLFLIPATIALGYPVYKNIDLLKKYKRIIYTAFVMSTLFAVFITYFLATICHTEVNTMVSMLPKSVTAPIAIDISKSAGGIPELTACVVVLTGVFGAMLGHKILKLIKVKSDIAIGLSIGAASHVIGTAKCVETDREKQIVMASVALVVVGVLTAIFVPLFLYILNLHG